MRKLFLLILTASLISACANQSIVEQKLMEVEFFFVSDTPRGLKLFSEFRELPESENLAQSALSELISGKITPLDPEYSNLWDSTHTLNSIQIIGTKATIDVNLGKLNVGSEGEIRAIDQIVWTLTGLEPSVTAVNFTVNGSVVESFAGHVDTTAEFSRAPEYEVLGPIQIRTVNENQVISSPVTLEGDACTFEANLVWTLYQDGKVIEESFTTAESACPLRSSWRVVLGDLPPGNYLFEAKEFSAEDGSLFAIDSKRFVVK
jgi:hypothetical protein